MAIYTFYVTAVSLSSAESRRVVNVIYTYITIDHDSLQSASRDKSRPTSGSVTSSHHPVSVMATNGELWQLIGPQSLEARMPEGRAFHTPVQCPCQRTVEMGESIKIISIHSNRFGIDIGSQNWVRLVTRSVIPLTTLAINLKQDCLLI